MLPPGVARQVSPARAIEKRVCSIGWRCKPFRMKAKAQPWQQKIRVTSCCLRALAVPVLMPNWASRLSPK